MPYASGRKVSAADVLKLTTQCLLVEQKIMTDEIT